MGQSLIHRKSLILNRSSQVLSGSMDLKKLPKRVRSTLEIILCRTIYYDLHKVALFPLKTFLAVYVARDPSKNESVAPFLNTLPIPFSSK